MTDEFSTKSKILDACAWGPPFIRIYIHERRVMDNLSLEGYTPKYSGDLIGWSSRDAETNFVRNDSFDTFLGEYCTNAAYEKRLIAFLCLPAYNKLCNHIRSDLKFRLAVTPNDYEAIGKQLIPILLGDNATQRDDILEFIKDLREKGVLPALEPFLAGDVFPSRNRSMILRNFFELCGSEGCNQLPTSDELWGKTISKASRQKHDNYCKEMGLTLP